MNLSFPLKALRYVSVSSILFPDVTRSFRSLVHGTTGVGKSLILAGIIGEADVVEGYIDLPQPPASNDPSCYPIITENWIIPTSVAYVAQIPVSSIDSCLASHD